MNDPDGAVLEAGPVSPAPALPFEGRELWPAFAAPTRAMALVLAQYDRLVRTLISGRHNVLLIAVLLYTSVLFALPYGAVLDPAGWWKVPVLFLGSLGICLPSLHVFSCYVGCKVNSDQNLALGLVITCVSSVFTFGFFPILWFLRETMADSPLVTVASLSLGFLTISLLAGIAHLYRCLRHFDDRVGRYPVLVSAWQGLFVFISYRMALVLGLISGS